MQEDANAAQRSAINANQWFPVIDYADALSLSLSLSGASGAVRADAWSKHVLVFDEGGRA